MKAGRTLQDLAAELTRQRETRRDFIVPTPLMKIDTKSEAGSVVLLENKGVGVEKLEVKDWAHGQISAHLQIPKQYYDRIRTHENPAVRSMFDETVNTLLTAKPEVRLVRSLDGKMRSFHSKRYQPFDNFELAEAVLPALNEAAAEVLSCEVTDSRFYLKAVSPRVTFNVKTAKRGDVIQAGFVISNSEVGAGSLKVEPLLYTLSCTNGAISEDTSFRRNHTGKALDSAMGEGAVEFFADDTKRQTDKAVFLQIRDIVRGTLTKEGFAKIVERMQAASDDKIEGDAFAAVEVVQTKFGLRDEERKGVLSHLLQGGDLSRYGVANALTRFSQDVPDYDRATEFERLGGRVFELPAREWKEIAEASA